jgi:hypothetical protein
MSYITYGILGKRINFIHKTIQESITRVVVKILGNPGYEKPPKEEFEAKLQELIDAQPLKELRQERDRRLQAVDWVAVKAFTTSTPVPEAWVTYMQALRDLPATTGDPKNPVWPTAPTS